jgi:hypothetical protein
LRVESMAVLMVEKKVASMDVMMVVLKAVMMAFS